MNISVTALGNIKPLIPKAKEITLERAVSLDELKVIAGIPQEKTVSYAVNGRVQKGESQVVDNDQVKFIMVVGAG